MAALRVAIAKNQKKKLLNVQKKMVTPENVIMKIVQLVNTRIVLKNCWTQIVTPASILRKKVVL